MRVEEAIGMLGVKLFCDFSWIWQLKWVDVTLLGLGMQDDFAPCFWWAAARLRGQT